MFNHGIGDNNNYYFDSGDLRGVARNNKYATTNESWVTTGKQFIRLKMSEVRVENIVFFKKTSFCNNFETTEN